jgi:hypothetical protein
MDTYKLERSQNQRQNTYFRKKIISKFNFEKNMKFENENTSVLSDFKVIYRSEYQLSKPKI